MGQHCGVCGPHEDSVVSRDDTELKDDLRETLGGDRGGESKISHVPDRWWGTIGLAILLGLRLGSGTVLRFFKGVDELRDVCKSFTYGSILLLVAIGCIGIRISEDTEVAEMSGDGPAEGE